MRWPYLKRNYQLVHTKVYVKRRVDFNNNKNKARTNDEDYALFLFVHENTLPIFFSPIFHANLEYSSNSTEMFPAPSSYWFHFFLFSSLLAVEAYAQG